MPTVRRIMNSKSTRPEQAEQHRQAAEEHRPAGGRDRDADGLGDGVVRSRRVACASSSRNRLVMSSE